MRLSTLLEGVAVAALLTTTATGAMAQSINGVIASFAAPTYAMEFSDYNATNPSSPIDFNTRTVKLDIGLAAFLINDGTLFGRGQSVHFAASDVVLSADSPSLTYWNTFQKPKAGNLTQLAMFGTPITLPFHGVSDGSGGTLAALTLSEVQECGVFSGRIKHVSDLVPAVTSTAKLSVAYRADPSSTSFLLTQHLAAVCGTPTTPGLTGQTEPVTFTATRDFASLFAHGVPSNFVGSFSNDTQSLLLPGMRQQVMKHENVIGYVGPNYTQIAPIHAGDATYPLVASLTNIQNGISSLPNVTNTSRALDNGSAGGIPVDANPRRGYPIVGYTTWAVAQCYRSADVVAKLQSFLGDHYNNFFDADLNNSGFTAVPGTVFADMVLNVLPTIQQGGTGGCADFVGR